MWFGNLVTMQWWTHLWLNEGFARFMEHCAVDFLFPEWDIWTNYLPAVFLVCRNETKVIIMKEEEEEGGKGGGGRGEEEEEGGGGGRGGGEKEEQDQKM